MALSGKVAVVTGAAMGIGKAFTEILLQNGAKVALLDVNTAAGESLVEALNKQYGAGQTLFLSCNVESEEQIKALFFGYGKGGGQENSWTKNLQSVFIRHQEAQKLMPHINSEKTVDAFGGFDIMCNNAGVLDEGTWEKTISINLMGVIRGTYVALEHMSKLSGGRGGVIVNTASMAGLSPLLSCPVYTAAKSGVVGFTRAMAAASEASGYGIRFNALCPGFVQTDLITAATTKLGQFSHLVSAARQIIDKMGILTVSQVAECLLELVKDETKNGEALVVFPKGKSYVTFPSFNQ